MNHHERSRSLTPAEWEHLPDEEILQLRVRDLGLRIQGSPVEPFVQQLYAELDARNIMYHPPCYLADEWLCPDRVPIIGIPFCLAHPRLKRIEQKMMLEVEGGTPESCMKLLRHECGHALNYAYLLYKKTRWRELFGHFSTPYSSSYSYQPYSKRYVVHLEDNYAQAHPDEDFAETFAVWLTSDSRGEDRYQGWPVMRKLRYVDSAMQKIGRHPPVVTAGATPWSAARMTSTLAAYYERKRSYMGEDFPGYYDRSLRQVFCGEADRLGTVRAAAFLRHYRRRITDSVTRWTQHRKYDIDQLVSKLAKRCDALQLYVPGPEAEALIEVTALITAVANKSLRAAPRGA